MGKNYGLRLCDAHLVKDGLLRELMYKGCYTESVKQIDSLVIKKQVEINNLLTLKRKVDAFREGDTTDVVVGVWPGDDRGKTEQDCED